MELGLLVLASLVRTIDDFFMAYIRAGLLLLLIVPSPAVAEASEQPIIHRICALVALHADQNGLPRDFLARLIWKESRFNP
ncbi:MAG: hypothetical protein MEQ84_12955, partial [Mesorhizobium sp.]|nr:hypothetical protein [Mesorhizobium sp.]